MDLSKKKKKTEENRSKCWKPDATMSPLSEKKQLQNYFKITNQ